jgi:hypothetical protein
MELPNYSQRMGSLVQGTEDVNAAMAIADEYGRVQYAYAAKDYAVEVTCDPQANLDEKATARHHDQSHGDHR